MITVVRSPSRLLQRISEQLVIVPSLTISMYKPRELYPCVPKKIAETATEKYISFLLFPSSREAQVALHSGPPSAANLDNRSFLIGTPSYFSNTCHGHKHSSFLACCLSPQVSCNGFLESYRQSKQDNHFVFLSLHR